MIAPRFGFEIEQKNLTLPELRRLLAFLEHLGFAEVWCWDHLIHPVEAYASLLEGWSLAAAFLGLTDRLDFGVLVANIMNRHPAMIAKSAATLSDLSGGRFRLALGAGADPVEHRAYGLEFPPLRERIARLGEAIDICRLLWTGEQVDYAGQYYSLAGALCRPCPRAGMEIVVGAFGAEQARLAGRAADGWNSFPNASYPRLRQVVLAELAARGRAPGSFDFSILADVPDDPQEAVEHWRALGVTHVILTAAPPFPYDRIEQCVEVAHASA